MEASSSQSLRVAQDIFIKLDDEEEDNGALVQRSLAGKVLSEKGLNREAVKQAKFRLRFELVLVHLSRRGRGNRGS